MVCKLSLTTGTALYVRTSGQLLALQTYSVAELDDDRWSQYGELGGYQS